MSISNLSQSAGLLFQYLQYAIVFVVMISILVAAHELGHYLFARMFGMGVEEFAIGFGKKPIWTWMRRNYTVPIKPGDDPSLGLGGAPEGAAGMAAALEGGSPLRHVERIDTPEGPALRETTEFTIRPLPLGGFVRIKGMMPDEDGSEVRIPGGFYNQAPWKRFLVLLAGPLFSVVAGLAILIPVFMFDGVERPQKEPIIGSLALEKAAGRAGMKAGDRLVSIDGQPIRSFYEMSALVQKSEGRTLRFEVSRKNLNHVLFVNPQYDKEPLPVLKPDLSFTDERIKTYRLGVSPAVKVVKLSFGEAVKEAVAMPVMAVKGIAKLFAAPSQFSETVSGPATMVSLTATAVRLGFWKILELSGLLSISVGIFNLLPAPPLDGGQMAMAIVEMFRNGRRLSIRAQAIASTLGLAFVAILVIGAFVVDFQRFVGPKDPAPAISTTEKPKSK